MLYVIPTTPEQDEMIKKILEELEDLEGDPNFEDNCSTRTTDALQKAGIKGITGENPTPADLQRDLKKMVKEGKATSFSSQQGSKVHQAWSHFDPN